MRRAKKPSTSTATQKAAGAAILAWEDDPQSGGKPIKRPVPRLARVPLALTITAAAVPAKVYRPGTREFRYWAAAEALRRGADFWGGLLPRGTSWQPGRTLRVTLDAGVDLNAYYDRRGLSFFHDTVGKTTVYSGESPDVVCHELGVLSRNNDSEFGCLSFLGGKGCERSSPRRTLRESALSHR